MSVTYGLGEPLGLVQYFVPMARSKRRTMSAMDKSMGKSVNTTPGPSKKTYPQDEGAVALGCDHRDKNLV